MFAEKDTLKTFTDSEIRKLHPLTSFPTPIQKEHVMGMGYLPVEIDPLPDVSHGESLVAGSLRLDGDKVIQGWTVVKAEAPSEVTMRQAKVALHLSGLLTEVNNVIENSTDSITKIEWEYSQTLRRDWPALISIANEMQLTEDEVDNLFIFASTL